VGGGQAGARHDVYQSNQFDFVSFYLLYLFPLSRRAHLVIVVIFALMLQSYSS